MAKIKKPLIVDEPPVLKGPESRPAVRGSRNVVFNGETGEFGLNDIDGNFAPLTDKQILNGRVAAAILNVQGVSPLERILYKALVDVPIDGMNFLKSMGYHVAPVGNPNDLNFLVQRARFNKQTNRFIEPDPNRWQPMEYDNDVGFIKSMMSLAFRVMKSGGIGAVAIDPDEAEAISDVLDFAGDAIFGGIVTTTSLIGTAIAPGPGTIAGGAIGGGLTETLRQGLAQEIGARPEGQFNPLAIGLATVAGGAEILGEVGVRKLVRGVAGPLQELQAGIASVSGQRFLPAREIWKRRAATMPNVLESSLTVANGIRASVKNSGANKMAEAAIVRNLIKEKAAQGTLVDMREVFTQLNKSSIRNEITDPIILQRIAQDVAKIEELGGIIPRRTVTDFVDIPTGERITVRVPDPAATQITAPVFEEVDVTKRISRTTTTGGKPPVPTGLGGNPAFSDVPIDKAFEIVSILDDIAEAAGVFKSSGGVKKTFERNARDAGGIGRRKIRAVFGDDTSDFAIASDVFADKVRILKALRKQLGKGVDVKDLLGGEQFVRSAFQNESTIKLLRDYRSRFGVDIEDSILNAITGEQFLAGGRPTIPSIPPRLTAQGGFLGPSMLRSAGVAPGGALAGGGATAGFLAGGPVGAGIGLAAGLSLGSPRANIGLTRILSGQTPRFPNLVPRVATQLVGPGITPGLQGAGARAANIATLQALIRKLTVEKREPVEF